MGQLILGSPLGYLEQREQHVNAAESARERGDTIEESRERRKANSFFSLALRAEDAQKAESARRARR